MKNRLLFIIKVLVSVGLLSYIALKIDWSQMTVCFKHGNLFSLSLAAAFGILFNLIKFKKWHCLIRSGNQNHSYWDGAKSYMIGNALGMVTPMRAGDLGRALYYPSSERAKIMGLTIVDRFVDLAIVFILSIAGSFALINKGFGILVATLFVLSLLLLYSPYAVQKTLKSIFFNGFIKNKTNQLSNIFETLNYKVITLSLFLSFLAFTVIIFEFYYLVAAFEDIHLVSIFLVAPLITLSTVIPVSLMGFGVREGISILLLSNFQISSVTALSAAFLFFIINNFSISIVGVIFLSRVEIKIKTSVQNDRAC